MEPIVYHVPLEPVPASRPRVTSRGWSYYAEPYKSFKELLHEWFKKNHTGDPIELPVQLEVIFSVSPPQSSKLSAPRPDVDNYAKAVQDAMNKVVLKDDSQVVRLVATKAWSSRKCGPGIYVRITPI